MKLFEMQWGKAQAASFFTLIATTPLQPHDAQRGQPT
jgi:hypothetical protein